MHSILLHAVSRRARAAFIYATALLALLALPLAAQTTLSVMDYGAKGDGVLRTDGAMTAGSPVLTSSSGSFSTSDAGKYIQVVGAGPGGTSHPDGAMAAGSAVLNSSSANFAQTDVGRGIVVVGAGANGTNLVTAIATVASSSSVTLIASAAGTVNRALYFYGAMTLEGTIKSVQSATNATLSTSAVATISAAMYSYGTDDHGAFQAALDAAGQAGGGTVNAPQPSNCATGAVCGYVLKTTDQTTSQAPAAIRIRYNNVSLVGASSQTNLFCRGAWSLYSDTVQFPGQTATIRGHCMMLGDANGPLGTAGESVSNSTISKLHLYGMTNGNTFTNAFSPTDPPLTTTGDGWDETHKGINMWGGGTFKNVTIDSVAIQDFKGENIFSGGSIITGMVISNCSMTNFNGDGISMLAADLQVINNTFTNGSNAAVENSTMGSWPEAALVRQLYQSNTITGMPREGIVVVGVDSVLPAGGIQIVNNTFDTIAQVNPSGALAAIYITNQGGGAVAPGNLTISGNICHDCREFASLQASPNIQVTGNTVIVDKYNADSVLGFFFPVANETVSNNTGYSTAAAAAKGLTMGQVYTIYPSFGTLAWNNVNVQNNNWNFPGSPNYTFITTSGSGWPSITNQNISWHGETCTGCTYPDVNHGLINLGSTSVLQPFGPVVSVTGSGGPVSATIDASKAVDGSQLQVVNAGSQPVTFNSDSNISLSSPMTLAGGGSVTFQYSKSLGKFTAGAASVAVALTPTSGALTAGQTLQFSATVTGSANQLVNWKISPAGMGTVSAVGLYTAPAALATSQTVTVTATSAADGTKSAIASVMLTPLSISLTPNNAALGAGQTQQFSATLSGGANPLVTWSLSPAGVGTLSATGLYTAPSSIPASQTVTITALSPADATKSVTASVTLTPVVVTLTPSSSDLIAGDTLQFAAAVAGSANQSVTWSLSPGGLGTVASSGLYTAPNSVLTTQTVTVAATSAADTAKSASASVTLMPLGLVASNGYGYHRTITVAHTQVPGADQTNFPVLIQGVYPFLATTGNGGHTQNANGYDIIFTSDSAGAHLLNWEVESYNPVTGAISVWVRVPTLSHSSDTPLYLFYGNSGVTMFQGDSTAAWDSNYGAVYHLSDNAANTTVADSTANGYAGTAAATTSAKNAVGQDGSALGFNGVSDYVHSQGSFPSGTAFTLEGWVKLSGWPNNGYGGFLAARGQQYFIEFTTDNSGAHGVTAGSYSGAFFAGTAKSLDASFVGAFHHLAASWDGSIWNLYLDGVLAAQSTSKQGPAPSAEPFTIGGQTFSGGTPIQFLNGLIGEVRVSSTARAASWIAAEYNNQRSPASFYSVGAEGLGTPSVAVSVSPASVALAASQAQQFSATVTGSTNQQVIWSISPAGVGTLSPGGQYTPPALISSAQTATVTATSAADATKSGSASVTLTPVGITVSPASVVLAASQAQQFSAAVTGSANQQVTWSLSPAGVGTLSANGQYTPPASIVSAQTVTVTATSAADATKSASTSVTLTAVAISLTPTNGALTSGQTLQFAAVVAGNANQQVAWSLSPAGAGTLSAAGLYTAPASIASAQTVTVTATSAADATKSARASVTLTPVAITLTPASGALIPGQTLQFVATVTGSANQQVTWKISPASTGTVSASGLYTAPALLSNAQDVTVTATSLADATKTVSASVTLTPVTITLTPASGALTSGQTLQFAASIVGSANQQVTWSLSPSGVGTLSAAGLYLAPALISSAQTVAVTATSAADVTKSATSNVTLTPAVAVSLSPAMGILTAGQTLQFVTTVTGSPNQQVTWKILPTSAGTVSATGLFTAPTSLSGVQNATVIATSVADATKSVSANVTLTPQGVVVGNSYGYRRTITVAHTQVPGADQTNFPVLVQGVYPFLASASNGGFVQSATGYDIVFAADSAGVQLLNWEVVSYDPATGAISAWVRVPVLSHSTDTPIYLFYGNANVNAFQGNSNATWDSNYQAVYHLADNAANAKVADSTADGFVGTAMARTNSKSVIGEDGPALSFNGVSDYVHSQGNFVSGNPFTLEGWVKLNGWPSNGYGGFLAAKGQQYFLEFTTDNSGAHGVTVGTYSGAFFAGTAKSLDGSFAGAFHHVAASWDGSIWSLYIDGALAAQSVSTQGPASSTEPFTIGGQTFSGGIPIQFLNGTIGEVRVSSTARPASWIATAYNNQSSPASFYSVAEEGLGAPSVAVMVSPSSATLGANQTQQFSATVTGSANQQVTWSASPAGVGTLSSTGSYTAPASISTVQTVTVTATTGGDATKSGAASVTLTPLAVTLTPARGALTVGQTLQFVAVVAGSANQQVTWSLSPLGTGSLSSTGFYTAPASIASTQNVTITATSSGDPSKSTSAVVTLGIVANNGYAYHRVITLAHTQVPADQSNFPVLIQGVYPFLVAKANGGNVQNGNGYDIAFTSDSAGTQLLNWEVESYNPTTGALSAWVRAPVLSHSMDTSIHLFYGNASVSSFQGNSTAAWDSNYQAVYHLSDDAANTAIADSSANGYTGIAAIDTNARSASGNNGPALLSFNGVSDYVHSQGNFTSGNPFTLEGWVKLNAWPNNGYGGFLAAKGLQYFVEFTTDNSGAHGVTGGTYLGAFFAGTAKSLDGSFAGAFHHMAATWDGSNWNLYIDGALAAQSASRQGPVSSGEPFTIGGQTFSGGTPIQFLNGVIGEVRVSSSARPASWIATEYNNQSAPGGFYSIGAEIQP